MNYITFVWITKNNSYENTKIVDQKNKIFVGHSYQLKVNFKNELNHIFWITKTNTCKNNKIFHWQKFICEAPLPTPGNFTNEVNHICWVIKINSCKISKTVCWNFFFLGHSYQLKVNSLMNKTTLLNYKN